MPLFFKDRIPDPIHGENTRYYDAIADNGTVKLSDFKLILKNNIPSDKLGDPVNAGNLNYASGNVTFPVASALETHRGDILSLMQDGVIPTKTKRAIAAKGLAYNIVSLYYGFLRLSDTKLLLMYADRMVIATVDFNNKTVSFGAYAMYSNLGAGSNQIFGNSMVLRSYDEHATALYCWILKSTAAPAYFYVGVISITGDAIPMGKQYAFPTTHTYMSNPVKVGNTSMLICSSTGTTGTNAAYASLLDCSSGTPTLTTQVQIPGVTGANIQHTLFCHDKANSKYVLIYSYSSNVYAVTVTVTGNSLSFGSPQLLGTATDTLFPSGQAYMPGGLNYFSDCEGKIILVANSDSGDGPARYQIFSVSSSGTVTKSTIQNLPIFNIINYYGASCIALGKNGRIYLTGIDYEITPRDACLMEITVSGTNAAIKKYRPFQSIAETSDTTARLYMKQGVFENPDSAGEFLFIQGHAAPLTDLTLWYGRRTDSAKPNNIVGIAIDEPENGYVRVQTTAKYLPGLFSNLKEGQLYSAGDNGALVPFTGAAGTKALGFALNQDDLLFNGWSY